MQKITTFLMFEGKAEEAMNFYMSLFPDSEIKSITQYKHSTKPGLVTVPGNPGDDLAPGTANNILKQAGLK